MIWYGLTKCYCLEHITVLLRVNSKGPRTEPCGIPSEITTSFGSGRISRMIIAVGHISIFHIKMIDDSRLYNDILYKGPGESMRLLFIFRATSFCLLWLVRNNRLCVRYRTMLFTSSSDYLWRVPCPALFERLQGFFAVHITICSTVRTYIWTVWTTVDARLRNTLAELECKLGIVLPLHCESTAEQSEPHRHLYNVDQRLRRWSNIVQML